MASLFGNEKKRAFRWTPYKILSLPYHPNVLIMKKHLITLLALLITASCVSAQRRVDVVDRGIVAMPRSANTLFVSWRHFATDPDDIAYNLYFKTSSEGALTKLNSTPITGGTNYVANLSTASSAYTFVVKSVVDGVERDEPGQFTVPRYAGIHRIVRDFDFEPLPAGHPNMAMKFCWPADLDGDGAYDFVLDRQHYGGDTNEEGGQAGQDYPSPKVEAYTSEGRFLWRIDMGYIVQICTGHNDMVTAYDMDGDGKAEVLMAVSEGTTFPDGTVITGANGQVTDYRTKVGPAPQWIAVVNGETGHLIDRLEVPLYNEQKNSGRTDSWKDISGHFIVCYLDGIHPSLIYQYKNRATNNAFYGAHAAFSYRNGQLIQEWVHPAPADLADFHQVRAADVDGDGRDNFVEGGYVLNPDGTVLNRHKDVIHGDRHCLADIDPDHPGLEHFIIQQDNPKTLGMGLYDAATGEQIKGHYQSAVGDVGRGLCGAFDPTRRGLQYWSTMNSYALYDRKGDLIEGAYGTFPSEALWWGPDLARWEISSIGSAGNNMAFHKYNPSTKGFDRDLPNLYNEKSPYYFKSVNAGRAAFWGDLLGDWREEIVCVRSDESGFVVLSTWEPTNFRLYHLMQNPAYRLQTTARGYYQTPDVDFYMAADMPQPPIAPVQRADLYYTGACWVNRDGQPAMYNDGQSVMFDIRSGSTTFDLDGAFSPSILYLMNPRGVNDTLSGEGRITGSTTVVKSMQGDVLLRGHHDYTGKTRVSEGRLFIDGSLTCPIQVDARGVVGGRGILWGGLVLEKGLNTEGGRIEVGLPGQTDTLTIVGNLTLVGRNNLAFDVVDAPTPACDVLHIRGDFHVNGSDNALIIQLNGEKPVGTLTLVTFEGSTNVTANSFNVLGLEGIPHTIIVTDSSLTLDIRASRAPASVEWTGLVNDTWDFITENFTHQQTATHFVPGDTVYFTASSVNKRITINETMPVGNLIFTGADYTLTGQGVISGTGGLYKFGEGLLSILNTEHRFTGPVDIDRGTLEVASLRDGGLPSSIGAASNHANNWIMRNATLMIRGQVSTNRSMVIVDTLTVTVPSISNSALLSGNLTGTNTTLLLQGNGSLTLQGSNTFSRVILRSGLLLLGSSDANRYAMGNARIRLEGGIFRMHDVNSTSDTGTFGNEIEVPEGKMARWELSSRWGIGSKLTGGGTLNVHIPYVRSDLNGDWSAFTGRIQFTGRDVRMNSAAARNLPLAEVNLGDGTYLMAARNGSNELSNGETFTFGALSGTGTISGRNNLTVGNKSTNTTFDGVINSGGGRLTKVGTGTLTLTGANAYTGGTFVNAGSLLVANTSGSATGTGTVTVQTAGTLSGNGSIGGQVLVKSGGTLAPGLPNSVGGTLKLNKGLSLGSGGRLLIKHSEAANDRMAIDGSVTLGGTLVLQNLGSAYTEGRQLPIFTATGAVSGGFEAIEPASPGEELEWDLSRLSEGILGVKQPTGLMQERGTKTTVFPSSTTGRCEVRCVSPTGSYTLEVLSVTGSLKARYVSATPTFELDLGAYAAGIYFLRIQAGDKVQTLKVVKQ